MKEIVGLNDNKILDSNYIAHEDSNGNIKTLHDKIENLEDYSTEEQVIGKWIDSNTVVCRKVVDYTLGNSVNSWKKVCDIPAPYKVISIEGTCYTSSTSECIPLPRSLNNEDISFFNNGGTLSEKHNYNYVNGWDARIIIKYLKTIS